MTLPRIGAKIRVLATNGDATMTMQDWVESWLEAHDELSFKFRSGFAFNSKMWPGWTITFDELEPPKPTLPPQPPDGTVVRVGSHLFERVNSDEFTPEHNWYETGVENPSRWEAVCVYGTPVPLVAVPDLAELVELARDTIGELEATWEAEHNGKCGRSDYQACQYGGCTTGREDIARRRALLAKHEVQP